MNRRNVFSALAALPFVGAYFSEVKAAGHPEVSESLGIPYPRDVVDMESLHRWIGTWEREQYTVDFSRFNESDAIWKDVSRAFIGVGLGRVFDRRGFKRDEWRQTGKSSSASFNEAYSSLMQGAAQRLYYLALFGHSGTRTPIAGKVYWREEPELSAENYYAMIKLDPNGPFRNYTNDEVGWVNEDYGHVRFWCRLSTDKGNEALLQDVAVPRSDNG
jgi:hypothetical protein